MSRAAPVSVQGCSPGITHHIRVLQGNSTNRRCVQGGANVGLQLWVCETQRFMQWWRLRSPTARNQDPGGAVSVWEPGDASSSTSAGENRCPSSNTAKKDALFLSHLFQSGLGGGDGAHPHCEINLFHSICRFKCYPYPEHPTDRPGINV